MSSVKCEQCGLVNFAGEVTCKRCHAPLTQTTRVASSSPQGIVLEDGYVLPPPPAVVGSGVWRQKSTLVMSRDAVLPYRCVKCNQETDKRLKRRLTWHHPALYLIIFAGVLIYLIVALIVRKVAVVEVGLCQEHQAKRRRSVLITWGLLLLGVGGFVLAIVAQDATYLLGGFLLFLVAMIYGIVVVRLVAPSKIDNQFVWLKGVNKDYLDELPQWIGD